MVEPRSIFISGVAGFVGSRLARAFIDREHPVFGFDNLSRGSRELFTHERFIVEKVDLSDASAVRSRFKKWKLASEALISAAFMLCFAGTQKWSDRRQRRCAAGGYNANPAGAETSWQS